MFDQYNEVSNYMTYDSSSLNQYSYKKEQCQIEQIDMDWIDNNTAVGPGQVVRQNIDITRNVPLVKIEKAEKFNPAHQHIELSSHILGLKPFQTFMVRLHCEGRSQEVMSPNY